MKMTHHVFPLVLPPPPPPPTKFALHIFFPHFSCESSLPSIYPSNIIQLRKMPNTWLTAYIVATNASQITKIRKAIQHFGGCDTRYYFRRKESGMIGIASITIDLIDKDGTCLMIATDRRAII